MRLYMYISTYTYMCRCVCILSRDLPVLCSKGAFKGFLSLIPVDLFMSIFPPMLRHTEFVRLVLTLPQGVRKCLSYLDAH